MNPTAMPSHNPQGPSPQPQPTHNPGAVPQSASHHNAQPQHQQDYAQPVAYDVEGRPLYLHPQTAAPVQPQQPPQPQMVYMSRPLEPQELHISEEAQKRHDDSRKKYPHVNLSDGEYVINAVKRHPIGILRIWAIAGILMITFSAMAAMFLFGDTGTIDMSGVSSMLIAGLVLLYALIILGALAATYIYENNRFYLTNESVIQEIQTSLFDKHEQTVSLGNIEDASYKQTHFIQSLFNYGSIRLSTEGDETTYRFDYVAAPKKHIATLNNSVEAFKNGRPVE